MKYTSSEIDIKTALHILPCEYWDKLDKAVKIRIENILFENVTSGEYDISNNNCRFGSLGTWIKTGHLMKFEDVNKWTYIIVDKIEKGDIEEKAYVENYFF